MKEPRRYREEGPLKRVYRGLNDLSDYALSKTLLRGQGYLLRESRQGVSLKILFPNRSESGGGDDLRRMVITSTQATGNNLAHYLTCAPYKDDGSVDSKVFLVAIPPYLRASTYDNLTLGGFHYFRPTSGPNIGQIQCSNAPGSATDYVVKSFFPPYATGQDIYALRPIGKTDVQVDNVVLEWIDANVEGRRLDTQLTKVSVCRLENGIAVTRNIVVEGGPIF